MTNIKPVGPHFFFQFNKSACTLCGDCFNKCPVMHLSKEESIEAEVYATELVGSETIVTLKIGENIVKAKAIPDFKASIGEKIYFAINKDKIHIFDKATCKVIV